MKVLTRAGRIAAVGCVTALFLSSAAHAGPGDRITRNPYLVRADDGRQPHMAVRSDGEFVVVWVSSAGIEAQRYLQNGSPNGAAQLVAPDPGPDFSYRHPVVSIGNDSGFVVAWAKHSRLADDSGTAVEARVWANGPRSDVITVSSPSNAPVPVPFRNVSVARDPDNGRFAVAWTAADPIVSRQSPYLRVFFGGGNPLGPPFRLSAPPTGARGSVPKVAMSNDGIAAAWTQGGGTSPFTLRAKFLTREGTPLSNAFTVANANADGELNTTSFEIAMGYHNDVVIAYPRVTSQHDELTATGLFARRYVLAATSPQRGGEFRVSSGIASFDLDVDVDIWGNAVFAWMDPGRKHLHTRLYRPGGIAVTNDERFRFNSVGNRDVTYVSVGLYGLGDFLVTFASEDFTDVMPDATYTQAFAGPQDTRVSCSRFIATMVGSTSGETINGGAGDDVINSLGGNDRVNGNGGSDVICGAGGADMLFGGPGPDEINGGPGDDVLDGGDGWDSCNGETQTNADTAVQCEAVSNVP